MGQAFIVRRGSSGATINFNNTSLVSWLTIPPTSAGVKNGASVSTSTKAVNAGGENSSGLSGSVFGIDKNLTKTSFENLTSLKKNHVGLEMNGLAAFAGGRNNGANFMTVDGFNPKTGEKVALTGIYYARGNMAAASNGKDSAFFGGDTREGGVFRTVDWYTHDYTHTHFDLDYPVSNAAAGSIAGKIFLAGGWYSKGPTYYNYVRIFNPDGTMSTGTNLSVPRKNLICVTIGDRRILFVGGEDANGILRNEIDVYGSDGSRNTVKYLQKGITGMVGMSFEDCAILLCGRTISGVSSKAYIIDDNLTITEIDLGTVRTNATAAKVGDYGLLFDGCSNAALSSFVNSIQALHVPKAITIPPGATYKLGSMTTEATATTFTTCPLTTPKLTGYIKISNITV